MTGILTEPIVTNRRLAAQGLDAYPTTTGEALSLTFDQDMISGPANYLTRILRTDPESAFDPTSPNYNWFGPWRERMRETGQMISKDEANRRFGIPGQLEFKTPEITVQTAMLRNRWKREEILREYNISKAENTAGLAWGRLGIGLATTFLDPVNVASAFIPVVGEARLAILAGKLGRVGKLLATSTGELTAAGRFARGAIEGAAGAAATEPIVYAGKQLTNSDYGLMDSLLNVAFGTALGGGLHMTLGALVRREGGRLAKEGNPISRAVENAGPQVQEAALRAKVAEIIEGSPRDVATALPELDPASKAAGDEFDRLFGGMTEGKPPAADDYFGDVGTGAAPEPKRAPAAPRFNLGEATGKGEKALYKNYTPVEPGDRRWLENVAGEVQQATPGAKVIDWEGRWQASAADFARYGEQTGVTFNPSTFPKWFTEMNEAGIKVTRESVARVARKLLAGEPLGVHEARIADDMMSVARADREENVRQMMQYRANREQQRWEYGGAREIQPDDRVAAQEIEMTTAPTRDLPTEKATDADVAAMEADIERETQMARAAGVEAPPAEAEAVADEIAEAEQIGRAYEAAAVCLMGAM